MASTKARAATINKNKTAHEAATTTRKTTISKSTGNETKLSSNSNKPTTKLEKETALKTAKAVKTRTDATTNQPQVASATKTAAKTATKGAIAGPAARASSQALHAKNPTNIINNNKSNNNKTAKEEQRVVNINNKSKQPIVKAKANAVLDTYHNVTVASPPQKRRESIKGEPKATSLRVNRERTLTRTLEPDEVVVLKRESAKQRIQAQIQDEVKLPAQQAVKEPIAFEVSFDEQKRTSAKQIQQELPAENENYSDDFESYESDFEASGSSTSAPEEDSSAESEAHSETHESVEGEDQKEEESESEEDEDEDSELTQNPITVIHQEKELERKLDSGVYDMNSRKQHKLSDISAQTTQQQFDSFDTYHSMAYSEQLDSGISTYENAYKMTPDANSFYGGYANFASKPIVSKRGLELMRKLQFDSLSYELFEMQPMSYDVFMQSYGKLNTCQTSTQTQLHNMHTECQTDELELRHMWTQHPPQYDRQTVQQQLSGHSCGSALQNCCGEAALEDYALQASANKDAYEHSLQQLNALRLSECQRTLQQQVQRQSKPMDFERLNAFLQKAARLISKVVVNSHKANKPGGSQVHTSLQTAEGTLAGISGGYIKLDAGFLNALRVRRIFGSERHQLIITVHECLPAATEVYRADFANLLMIWSTTESTKPLRLLSTWAEVCRAEICNDFADIVICGLRDGSVAMWDLRETYTYCSRLDGHLPHFAATQSIVPNLGSAESRALLDLGAVVDVRSFRAPLNATLVTSTLPNYKSIQFTSLNDTGILTVWTLVETSAREFSVPHTGNKRQAANYNHTKSEYSSPWARVKLIQSAICQLRDYLERRLLKSQSQYDKTKVLFQKNIYSDELLRELNETQTVSNVLQGQGLQGLRFTSIDTGCERIYVCTNRNFILACTKSLKPERFARVAINDSRFLFPTALCVLANEDFLAVGLSNGSVIILNCNQQSTQLHKHQMSSLAGTTLALKALQQSQATESIAELETGKSCAIQNIILNERRSADASQGYAADFELRPTTAACIELINNQKRPFELRVYDQQLLLSGSALRKHLVQSLVLSSDGWRLFALANGTLRVYDFFLDRELPSQAEPSKQQRVEDIAIARTSANQQHVVLLNALNEVQLHIISQ